MGVEARIGELRDAGELSGLPGEGQPLPPDPDAEASDAWAARHVLRTSGARPLWADLRRDITERRTRIVTRLRAHLAWLERRQALLAHVPAERIVPEVELTNETDARVRAEVSHSIVELNTLVRHHNLVVTATSVHLALVTFEGLLDVARASRA
jgi:hypothetical protein